MQNPDPSFWRDVAPEIAIFAGIAIVLVFILNRGISRFRGDTKDRG